MSNSATIYRGSDNSAATENNNSKVQTRRFRGWYRSLRLLGAGLLCVLFFAAVWLDWNGRQAVHWDLSNKQFHIFNQTFWPQDLTLLAALLMAAAFALFLTTVVAGRVWCGFACPQSVWTWMFMWIEQQCEGDRYQRIRLDQAPWSRQKWLRRTAKHAGWLAISVVTGMTFVGYFYPIKTMLLELSALELSLSTTFWVGFFSLMTYLNAGWVREKVCFHMCPYGRFQSVMLDADSRVVTYDVARGEPRGSRKPGGNPQMLGDCVDCTLCVQVCPTGIDIRQGLQMECIGCAACIDACNSVMDKLHYPRGLIRYASENQLAKRFSPLLRPRVIGLGLLLVTVLVAIAWGFTQRSLVDLSVAKDRMLYRELDNGQIENSFLVKVTNKDQHARPYKLAVIHGAERDTEGALLYEKKFELNAGSEQTLSVVVTVSPQSLSTPSLSTSSRDLSFTVSSDELRALHSATVLSRLSLP